MLVVVPDGMAMAGCPRAVRALADLLWPAAPLADRWDLVQGVGGAGRRRARLRPRALQPGAVGGGASGSSGRGPGGGAATATTTAPAAPWAASTNAGHEVSGQLTQAAAQLGEPGGSGAQPES